MITRPRYPLAATTNPEERSGVDVLRHHMARPAVLGVERPVGHHGCWWRGVLTRRWRAGTVCRSRVSAPLGCSRNNSSRRRLICCRAGSSAHQPRRDCCLEGEVVPSRAAAWGRSAAGHSACCTTRDFSGALGADWRYRSKHHTDSDFESACSAVLDPTALQRCAIAGSRAHVCHAHCG